jgi:hypothetical protein
MRAIGRFSASLGLALTAAAASAVGLQPPDSSQVWPQWQARLTVSMLPPSTGSLLTAFESGVPRDLRDLPQTTLLLGDYFFRVPGLGLLERYGSLRASTGLLINQRGVGLPGTPAPGLGDSQRDPSSTLPYLGLGYSSLSLKGGWNFDADIGIVAGNPSGAWRFGRALLGNQGSDGAMRDLRLSPVLQLGMRYSF